MDDPTSTTTWYSAGAAVLTLCLLYCMLLARSAGKGSPQRLAATVIPRSRSHYAPTPIHAELSSRRAFRYSGPATMLRGAVQKHEKENAHRATSSQDFFSSPPSPVKQTSQRNGSQSVSHGYRNPLHPANSSVLNQARGFGQQSRGPGGIKRTASGLAKALDGSFEDLPGAYDRPIVVNDPKTQTQVTFDENDFDSDVDLDFEEPKAAVTYPKLPQQPKQAPMAAPMKPTLYPTLPRQQQAQPKAGVPDSPIDSAYSRGQTQQPASQRSPPKSSAPLPWSSSPSEHLAKPSIPSLSEYRYDAADPQPKKRRTIPWNTQEDETEPHPSDSTASTKLKRTVSSATPLPKDRKKPMFPWNTTASAVKEQQKKHREDSSKKALMKSGQGTEEDRRAAKSARKRPARVFLSDEQQHVLNLVVEEGRSVFFTGSAGTGKSVLLREIIASLRKKYQREPDRVACTASTGLAACNIGGVTLHSFAGIGLGKEDVPELVRRIKKNQKAKHRWMRTKVLIIDEVSMVDADLFDKLESIARQIRNNGRVFGGIKLVITGDFFQLPPVPEGYGRVAKFAFDAGSWNTAVEHTIGLHHVFRQKDPVFAGMLNEMREGRLTPSSIRAFQGLSRPLQFDDELGATELFPTRQEVERANTDRLGRLQGKTQIFEARDGGAIVDKAQRDKILSNCMAPESITLKTGAQVMLIKNIDENLVNGSIGRVVGFMSEAQFDHYDAHEDEYAKSLGGKTLDQNTQAGDSGVAVHSMGPTGPFSTTRTFPLVRFILPDGQTRDLLCQPETWKVEQPNGEVQASRSQVPLILAWALSIHKAQGQTLERVKVDLGKVFEKGQAYVALSRATSIQGLQVLRFDPKKVVAHEKVARFYGNLSRVELEGKGSGEKKGGSGGGGGIKEDYEKRFVDDGI